MQIQDFIIAIANLILILTFIFYPTFQTKVHKSWVVKTFSEIKYLK